VTVVFDGAPLPSKRDTEIIRRKAREESLIRARELEASGDKTQAYAFYAKSVDVTPEMAFKVTQAIRPMGVEVIVAPYEADAQLAYLSRNNLIDFVISEDSDLLVYGCSRVLYKFDYRTEKGREIVTSNIFQNHPDFSRISTPISFLITCILSGCDYLPSLNQVGIRKAISIGTRLENFLTPSVTLESVVNRVITLLKLSNFNTECIEDLDGQIMRAILTFQHQTIFCPNEKKLVYLSEIWHAFPTTEFLGELYDCETAIRVANCEIHPETKLPFCLSEKVEEEKPVNPVSKTRPVRRLKKSSRDPKCLTLMACWSALTDSTNRAGIISSGDGREDDKKDQVTVISLSPDSPDSPDSPKHPPLKITRINPLPPSSSSSLPPTDNVLDLEKFSLEEYVSQN